MCNPAISKDLILDNELEIVVKLAAAECYAVHSRGNNDRLLLDIGMHKQNFRLAGASPTYLPTIVVREVFFFFLVFLGVGLY